MTTNRPVLSRTDLLAVVEMERHGPRPGIVDALSARRADLLDMSLPRDPELVANFVNRLGGRLFDLAPDHLNYLARQVLFRQRRESRGGS